MIKFVFFDLGGVLEDARNLKKQIMGITIEVLKEVGLDQPDIFHRISSYRKILSKNFGKKPFENRYFYWRDVIKLIKHEEPKINEIREAYKSYLSYYSRLVEIYDDVKPCFELLRENNIFLALLTNATMEKTELFIRKFNLSTYLKDVFISEMLGSNKPLSMMFKYALWKLDVSTQEVVHVGDRIDTDIAGAMQMNIDSILIKRETKIVDNVNNVFNVVKSLSEIPAIISNY